MTEEKKIAEAQDSRLAQVLKNQFGNYLQHRRDMELVKLKQEFRSGNPTLVTLSSHLAVLCALDDLEMDLDKKIRRGHNQETENLK